jgi:hypothetical protein
MKTLIIFAIGLFLAVGLVLAAETKHNFKPKEGYVPDEKTAIAIAAAVWLPIYGEQTIQNEKPFKAVLKDGVWHVEGTLPAQYTRGGVAEAEISKEDGKILRISHGR